MSDGEPGVDVRDAPGDQGAEPVCDERTGGRAAEPAAPATPEATPAPRELNALPAAPTLTRGRVLVEPAGLAPGRLATLAWAWWLAAETGRP